MCNFRGLIFTTQYVQCVQQEKMNIINQTNSTKEAHLTLARGKVSKKCYPLLFIVLVLNTNQALEKVLA